MTNIHAIARAKERYGIIIDGAGLAILAASVAAGNGLLVRRQYLSHGELREDYIVRVDGQAVRLIYEPKSQQIITFLPPHGRLKCRVVGRAREKRKHQRAKRLWKYAGEVHG